MAIFCEFKRTIIPQPLNLNNGSKLNLGSTAKLRTLIHYLEIVATLHERYHDLNNKGIKSTEVGACRQNQSMGHFLPDAHWRPSTWEHAE